MQYSPKRNCLVSWGSCSIGPWGIVSVGWYIYIHMHIKFMWKVIHLYISWFIISRLLIVSLLLLLYMAPLVNSGFQYLLVAHKAGGFRWRPIHCITLNTVCLLLVNSVWSKRLVHKSLVHATKSRWYLLLTILTCIVYWSTASWLPRLLHIHKWWFLWCESP